MYDGLRNFFVECVLADHDAYREARDIKIAGLSMDLRLAVHACSSMFHLADHVFDKFNSNSSIFPFISLKNYQTYLVKLCPDFEIVRDCANVHKHHRLTRHTPLLSSAESLEEVVVTTEYQDDKGAYRIAEKEIRVKLDNGTIKILHECLDSVRNMWWDELLRLGVMSSPSSAPKKIQLYPPLREHEGETALLDLRLRQGERFKQSMILQRFNYETMKAEPIDLTGYQVSGGIYKPNYVIDFSIQNDKTGESLTRSIELTEEQNQKLLELKSEKEVQSFTTIAIHQAAQLWAQARQQ
ncbi:MAG: hypothetical protein NVS2B14_15830 [Chamaesiphon sp.]